MIRDNEKDLREIIIEKIKKDGPVSFHDFMEMALYYPGYGYYTSSAEKIGKNGDYYTSSMVSPVFGTLIAKQIEEIWKVLGEEAFTIVEYGAGTGKLCYDILEALSKNDSLYKNLHYCIIEKSPAMQELEKLLLQGKPVSWYHDLSEIRNFSGCIISNEVLDNFSVHQVVKRGKLMEVHVDYKDGFVETLLPASESLVAYFDELRVELPDGFRTEVNLEAINWLSGISENIRKGYVITIDYGFPAFELYRDYRKEGTIVCYNRHKVNSTPYHNIGSQDITAHVNFSALYHWGGKNGLDCCGFTDQGHFLKALGFKEQLKGLSEQPGSKAPDIRKIIFLEETLLYDMGQKFKVLVQQKGMPQNNLTGLT
jgi:SAM-dependent MidA family methyltransferase